MKFMLFDRVFIYYKYARFDFPVSNPDKKKHLKLLSLT